MTEAIGHGLKRPHHRRGEEEENKQMTSKIYDGISKLTPHRASETNHV